MPCLGLQLRPSTATATARTKDRRPLEKLPEDEQLLVRAAALVARGWCRRAPAEDWRGRPVDPRSASACRWSPLGALTKVWAESPGLSPDVFRTAWAALALATGGRPKDWSAAQWRTRAHVLRAFERARNSLPQARERVLRQGASPHGGHGSSEAIGTTEPGSIDREEAGGPDRQDETRHAERAVAKNGARADSLSGQ